MESSTTSPGALRFGSLTVALIFVSSVLSGCLIEAAVYVVAVPIAAVAGAAGDSVQGSINESRRETAMEAKREGERVFQSEILEARASETAAEANAIPVMLGASSQSWASEGNLEASVKQGTATASEQVRVALLPADGWSLAGSSSSAGTEERIHEFAREMLSDSGLSFVDRSQEDSFYRGELWKGGSVNKTLNVAYAVTEGQRLEVDGVLTFSYILRGNKGGYNADVEVGLVDVETGRVYQESGSSKVLRDSTARILRSFEEEHRILAAGPARLVSEDFVKVGVLPPSFLNPTLPSSGEKELAIYDEIRRYIRSSPTLSLSYDYAARDGVGSLDTHGIWHGSVTKKVPDIDKMRAIGEELGVDVLVLAWIAGNAANPTIDLYVFEMGAGKMNQSTSNLGQAKQLVESTFALSRAIE